MVKINDVIPGYLSLTGKTMRQKIVTYVSWFNYGRAFKKFKPLPVSTKIIFIEFLLQRKLSFIRVYTLKLLNLAGFLAHVQQFSRLLDKFEDWVSCEAVWPFLINFSVWFFKMEFKHSPDFWTPDLQLLKLICSMVANIWEWKYAIPDLFWQDHFKFLVST